VSKYNNHLIIRTFGMAVMGENCGDELFLQIIARADLVPLNIRLKFGSKQIVF